MTHEPNRSGELPSREMPVGTTYANPIEHIAALQQALRLLTIQNEQLKKSLKDTNATHKASLKGIVFGHEQAMREAQEEIARLDAGVDVRDVLKENRTLTQRAQGLQARVEELESKLKEQEKWDIDWQEVLKERLELTQRAERLQAEVEQWKLEMNESTHWNQTLMVEKQKLMQQLAERRALAERLKLEAEGHAFEARAQRATVQEIYQLISGGAGEPGDWNGAEPVRKWMAERGAEIEVFLESNSNLTNEVLALRSEIETLKANQIPQGWICHP